MKKYYYIFWTKYYEFVFREKRDNNGNLIYMFHSIHDGKTNPNTFASNKESTLDNW